MPRTDLYLKITVEHERSESPEKLAEEILRQVRKVYGVEGAELSNWVSVAEEQKLTRG